MEKIECVRKGNVVLGSMQRILKNIISDSIHNVDAINMFLEEIVCADENLKNYTEKQVYEGIDQYIAGAYEIFSFLVSE